MAAVPIAHALLLAALAAAASTDRVPLDLLVQQMVAQVQSFPLIAIPFFMLTGALMMGGRLGEAIVGTLTALVGRWHGGPAQVSVLSSTLFGGVSGSAVADASAIGSLLMPWHRRLGYPMAFSAAALAAAATIDIIIPPSIPMILFALTANESIAALFSAGILPGLVLCGGFMTACWWVGKRRNLPRETGPTDRAAFRHHWPAVLGAGDPAADHDHHPAALRHRDADRSRRAVDAVRRGRVAADLPRPELKRLHAAIVEAGLATGVVLLVIMASAAMGWLLTFDQMPQGRRGLVQAKRARQVARHPADEPDDAVHRHVHRPAGRGAAADAGVSHRWRRRSAWIRYSSA